MPIKADLESEFGREPSTIVLDATPPVKRNTNNSQLSQHNIPPIQATTAANPLLTGAAPPTTKGLARFDGGEQQIIVACRLRPLTEPEIIQGSKIVGHKVADDNMVVLMDPAEDPDDILRQNRSRERQFVFDMVFDSRASQQDVFEGTTKSLLPGVLNGYNATVFAYGATGAGKTHTMLGTEEDPGIMFRTLHNLFIEISNNSEDQIYQVSMSYLEIYNELIRDLLKPNNGFLELREDAKGGVQVAGISELVAETPQEVMYMLHKGNKQRTQEPTKANKTSSRSHAVLQVNIKQRNKLRKQTQEIRMGRLYMIDLAGSERAAQTQNKGKRMVEGAHINRSLLALGNCINALSDKSATKYVNYRDSKLTRILKDALGGNSKTVMIAHVSPASFHFEESRNTLVYSDRAKYIRTKVRRNVIDVSYHISQYQQIIQELAMEISTLKDQRSDLESRISHLDPRISSMNSEDRVKLEEALKLRESLLQSFKQQINLRKNILELENAIMDLNSDQERHKKIISDEETSAKDKNANKEQLEEIVAAAKASKAELSVIEKEKDNLCDKKKSTVAEYQSEMKKTKRLRETAAKKLNNSEQKEILSLLLKNFEFEIRNIEMQAEIFKRDFKLREQDMTILRLEQHRSLCDTLIFQQKQLIDQNKIQLPQDLNELYFLYSRDTHDGQLARDLLQTNSRSTPNLSQVSNSNISSTSAFLSQIDENKVSQNLLSEPKPKNVANSKPQAATAAAAPGSADDFMAQYKMMTNNSGSNNNDSSLIMNNSNYESDYLESQKIFYRPNNKVNNNRASNIKNNNNSISSSSNANNKDHSYLAFNGKENNVSMLSSSTTDSNMEIFMEKAPSVSNKHLIKTAANGGGGGGGKYSQNYASIHRQQPPDINTTNTPGQVQPLEMQPLKSNTTTTNGTTTTTKAKRHTQGIMAVAAQRKATQHHKQLMQELGDNDNSGALTTSSLANHNSNNTHDNSNVSENFFFEKKNASDVSERQPIKKKNKKKQVKIQEVVHFKLPDDTSMLAKHDKNNLSSDTYDQFGLNPQPSNDELIQRNIKQVGQKNSYNSRRSKSNNTLPRPKNLPAINSINNSSSNQAASSSTTNPSNATASKIPKPSIPNYGKNVASMSVAGTKIT